MRVPRYTGLSPASEKASKAARASSKQRDTKPELLLRKALFALGARYRVDVRTLPGRPDIVFSRVQVVVFVDGDFWHGRDLEERLERLRGGHNAGYWVRKVSSNVERDRRHDASLHGLGYEVIRVWETDVAKAPHQIATRIMDVVWAKKPRDT